MVWTYMEPGTVSTDGSQIMETGSDRRDRICDSYYYRGTLMKNPKGFGAIRISQNGHLIDAVKAEVGDGK